MGRLQKHDAGSRAYALYVLAGRGKAARLLRVLRTAEKRLSCGREGLYRLSRGPIKGRLV